MSEQKIAYEKHPVTPERKKELRDKGYKIIDAQFAPEGYEHPEPAKGKGAGKPSHGLRIDDIKAKLAEKGISFNPDAERGELAKLLDEAE
ncbi:hypothetical protein ACIPL1_24725 [Pseudomonas sp. NPDC090202]|uniref:hypothetical protein n=1 Tax=Pseudomonas sp. NPDC090202 TaxID=3364476 RepID=UPI0038243B55